MTLQLSVLAYCNSLRLALAEGLHSLIYSQGYNCTVIAFNILQGYGYSF